MITVNVVTCQELSFQIKSMTSQQTWNRLRALKLCAVYCQSCVEFLTTLGTAAIMACSYRHTGQIQSLHHQNLAFWYCPNFVCHFLVHFLRIEILELTVKKYMWTCWHLNVRNKCFMNVLVPWTPLRVWWNLLTPSHKNVFKYIK